MTVERVSIEEWLAYDAAFPAPTFFARPAWALALQDANPSVEAAPLRVKLASGKHAIVPLVKLNGGALRFKDYSGFPLGGYTMALHEDGTAASCAEWNGIVESLARYADGLTLVPWPLGEVPTGFEASSRPHETAVVDLRDGLDAAMQNVAGIFRRMAGQAERRGVECAPCDGENAVDDYYALLERSAQRWGIEKPTIAKPLVAALKQRGGADVEIWFSEVDGARIGGGIVFYGATEFFFWSAAMDAEYGRLRPSNALNFALLRAASARGMSWYNLGSSEGLPGVARFKRDLGATDISYGELQMKRLPYEMYARMRRAITARKPAKVTA